MKIYKYKNLFYYYNAYFEFYSTIILLIFVIFIN